MWEISLSGTRDDVLSRLPSGAEVLGDLIRSTPGTHLSITGRLTRSVDESHGMLELSGSFWTQE